MAYGEAIGDSGIDEIKTAHTKNAYIWRTDFSYDDYEKLSPEFQAMADLQSRVKK